MQLHLNRTTPQVHLNRQQPQPKSESGRKCNPQTSADVLSSSSPRQQRGRVPILHETSVQLERETSRQTIKLKITQYVRPPESTRTHHETILKLGKSSPAIINHNSNDHQVHVQPNTEHTTTKPPPKVQIQQQTRWEDIPTIVQTCPSRILNQEISSSSSINTYVSRICSSVQCSCLIWSFSRNLDFSRSSITSTKQISIFTIISNLKISLFFKDHNQSSIIDHVHHRLLSNLIFVFFSSSSSSHVNQSNLKSHSSSRSSTSMINRQSLSSSSSLNTSQSSSSSAQFSQSSNQSHKTKTRQKKTQNDKNNAKIMSSLHINHWIHQNSTLHNTRSRRHKNKHKKRYQSKPLSLSIVSSRSGLKKFLLILSSLLKSVSKLNQISNLSFFSSFSRLSHSFWDSSNAQKESWCFDFRVTCHGHTSHVRQQTTRS